MELILVLEEFLGREFEAGAVVVVCCLDDGDDEDDEVDEVDEVVDGLPGPFARAAFLLSWFSSELELEPVLFPI